MDAERTLITGVHVNRPRDRDRGSWHVAVSVAHAPATADPAHLAMLSAEERVVFDRLRGTARKARYACAHALLRCQLGTALGQAPREVSIIAGPKRRPRLAGKSAAQVRDSDFDFNLTSTDGLVACALATGKGTALTVNSDRESLADRHPALRIGIDLEAPKADIDTDALREMVLTGAEIRWLETMQQGDTSRFYQLWTLKEALAKADGEGLGLPMNQLTVLPDGRGSLQVELAAMQEDPAHWALYSLDAGVPAALAVRLGPARSARQLSVSFNESAPAGFCMQPVRERAHHPRRNQTG